MQNNNRTLKVLYWLMFRFMDLESIMWWVADHIIYPVALIRRYIASIINKKLGNARDAVIGTAEAKYEIK